MHGGARGNGLASNRNAIGFALHGLSHRPAIPLAHDNHRLTLARLVRCFAAVFPVLSFVCWLDVAAEVSAVDLDVTFERTLLSG